MDAFKQLEELTKEIESSKEITLDKQIDLDVQIMELQFEGFNAVFEDLRDKLGNLEIVEEVIESPVEEDPILEDLKALTVEEMTKKYKIADANAIAKKLGTTRPKDAEGKNVKELEYWKHLKSLV